LKLSSALLSLLVVAAPAAAARAHPARRCGWLDNPTPGNWWLHDRTGTWTIGEQGGYQAEGLDDLPDMSTNGVVHTNGVHGYSCACMTVSVDKRSRQVVRVYSGKPEPLRRCRADTSLHRP
jgi:hypothetical protein